MQTCALDLMLGSIICNMKSILTHSHHIWQLMMASTKSIIFFADGSEETQSGLRRLLLAHPGGSLLSRFLSDVTSALRQELQYIPPVDRDGLPALESLSELVNDPFDESIRHPALHPTEIVLVHLGHFIA